MARRYYSVAAAMAGVMKSLDRVDEVYLGMCNEDQERPAFVNDDVAIRQQIDEGSKVWLGRNRISRLFHRRANRHSVVPVERESRQTAQADKAKLSKRFD